MLAIAGMRQLGNRRIREINGLLYAVFLLREFGMDFDKESFRWGLEHLSEADETWLELENVIRGISRQDVLAQKIISFEKWRNGKIKSPKVGGQDPINRIFTERLEKLGWESQIFVLDLDDRVLEETYDELEPPLEGEEQIQEDVDVLGAGKPKKKSKKKSKKRESYWTMDFKKGLIGVEVSFNNAGVLAQNLLRLSVMSESYKKPKDKKIRLGILITANSALKKWSNMDSTTLTFETVNRVFPAVNFNIPTPIVVIGLNNSTDGEVWADSLLFGHKKLAPYAEISMAEKVIWDDIINQAKN